MEPNEDVRRFLAGAGRKGGKARARRLTAEQRSEIARRGGLARAESMRSKKRRTSKKG